MEPMNPINKDHDGLPGDTFAECAKKHHGLMMKVKTRILNRYPALRGHEDDLEADLLLKLWDAFRSFDPNGSARFATYAYKVMNRRGERSHKEILGLPWKRTANPRKLPHYDIEPIDGPALDGLSGNCISEYAERLQRQEAEAILDDAAKRLSTGPKSLLTYERSGGSRALRRIQEPHHTVRRRRLNGICISIGELSCPTQVLPQ